MAMWVSAWRSTLLAGVVAAAALHGRVAAARPSIPDRVLPGGGRLPMLYMGAGNFTSWLELAGKGAGVKTAWSYHNQPSIMPAVTAAGMKRSDVFLETMVPCGGIDGGVEPMNASMAKWYIQNDLELLQTSYVDLLLMHHRCATPAETRDVWTALEAAVTSGTARAIGVSNFDADDLAMLQAFATQPIAVNEGHFAVGVMDYETIAFARQHNITLVSFSSLSAGVPLDDPVVSSIAMNHNVSSASIMLRYVSQHNISILSSISKPEYTVEDIDIFDLQLTSDDMKRLDALQTGKRTDADCFTNECQACASALHSVGCPVGNMPVWGRDNPNSARCMNCAEQHNATVMKTCLEQWMIPKACGTAGGFPPS